MVLSSSTEIILSFDLTAFQDFLLSAALFNAHNNKSVNLCYFYLAHPNDYFQMIVIKWLKNLHSRALSLSPDASYVQRWAPYSNRPANV